MERAVFDRMEAIDSSHWWFTGRRAILGELLRRHAPADTRRVLEVGCGTGSNLAMLGAFGRVDAIEPDDGARAIAAARSGLAVAGGLLPDGVAIEDGAYDVIVLLDVLEHIADDRAALALLAAKLAPGGRLVITVPAAPWMWSAHDVAHHHHRRYDWPTLRARLAEAGLRTRHHTHFNTLLYPLVALARVAGRITGREGGDDALPAGPINRLLGAVFAFERRWAARRSVPIGVSLAVVAERA